MAPYGGRLPDDKYPEIEKIDSVNEIIGTLLVKAHENLSSFGPLGDKEEARYGIDELAWSMVLLNFRLIFAKTSQFPGWKNWSNEAQADYLQCAMLASFEIAKKFEPNRGKFSTFLYISMHEKTMRTYCKYSGVGYVEYEYLQSYAKALDYADNSERAINGEEIDIMATLKYAQLIREVSFAEGMDEKAYQEYLKNVREKTDKTKNKVLKWNVDKPIESGTLIRRIKRINLILQLNNLDSLDKERDVTIVGESGLETISVSLGEKVADSGPDVHEIADQEDLERQINIAMERLNIRQKLVIELYYGLNGNRVHIFREIGDVLNVTTSRAEEIHDRALIILRRNYKLKQL